MAIFFPVLGAVLTVAGIGIDWFLAVRMDDSVSQMEALLLSIRTGATLEDMISQCWMIFLFLGFVFWLALCIAFPKRSKEGHRP